MAVNEDPFTFEDLQTILREEKNNSEEDGWHFVRRTETAEIWKKDDDNSPVKLIKGFLRFPGIPPSHVIEMIADLNVRRRWEKQFPVIDVIEEFPNYKIVYWVVKMPFGVYDRDLVQCISHRKDEDTNLHYILYKNSADERRPEQPGLVRAKTILSGVLIRPGKDDPNSTQLTILMQNDPMGWIPKSIVNMFASRAPVDWQQSMIQFYRDVYSKEKAQQQD